MDRGAAFRSGGSEKRAPALAFLGLAGLALMMWPAFRAPVVTWSDSAIDLAWAREGVGLVKPPAASPDVVVGHPPKAAYLLFLAVAMRIVPAVGEAQSVVIVQSLLLWLSIAGTSLYVARRRGAAAGVVAYALVLAILRLRDCASAVMPEAFAATLFLPIAALILDPPTRLSGCLALGGATAVLFFVRPNLAALAGVTTVVSLALELRPRDAALFALA
ncbi:MAG TPA: hypothetical protein VIZ69_14240, partial [Thermoanaerobaculia bacterium]